MLFKAEDGIRDLVRSRGLGDVYKRQTLADVAGDPTAGAGLYSENCVMCHGDKGQGRIGARLSKAFSGIRPDLSVRSTIINGISGSAMPAWSCLLYTSDAADERSSVDLGGRRIIKKKKSSDIAEHHRETRKITNQCQWTYRAQDKRVR